MNQYNVYSAWFDVNFGGCEYGVFSAAMPIEPLHSLENGLMADCLKIMFDEDLTDRQCKDLDQICKILVTFDRQFFVSSGARKEMPTLLWKSGITSLSFTHANEKVGIMLTIVILSLTIRGKEYFLKIYNPDQLQNMQEVFQMMLCYWSWLKGDKFWNRGYKQAKERYLDSIRKMLSQLNRLWPRMKGRG